MFRAMRRRATAMLPLLRYSIPGAFHTIYTTMIAVIAGRTAASPAAAEPLLRAALAALLAADYLCRRAGHYGWRHAR